MIGFVDHDRPGNIVPVATQTSSLGNRFSPTKTTVFARHLVRHGHVITSARHEFKSNYRAASHG